MRGIVTQVAEVNLPLSVDAPPMHFQIHLFICFINTFFAIEFSLLLLPLLWFFLFLFNIGLFFILFIFQFLLFSLQFPFQFILLYFRQVVAFSV